MLNEITKPRYIRTTPAAAKGEPTLLVSSTSVYDWIYDDKGSGAKQDVTIYRPRPTEEGYSIVGHYAQGNFSQPTGSSMIVKAINEDPGSPLLKPPSDFRSVWNDRKSGGDYDGSIWYPVPPDGYVTIGYVGQLGYERPSISNYACVRRDLVEEATVGSPIWSDAGSGAAEDVTIWKIDGSPGMFVAQANHDPFTGTAYRLKTK
jgi:Vacuolar protein sorting-associated protein 62